MSHSDFVIHQRKATPHGDLGLITLNRPDALNAQTCSMLKTIHQQLLSWQDDDSILAIVMNSTGDRAFCAGGDIRAMYETKDDVEVGSVPFFKTEYRLNEYLFNYPKPYLPILDGITMGGGVGISIWGSTPIATERLKFAMPETAIGLFPDIGASYFLTRLPNKIGYMLGLTGLSINAYEALTLGLIKTVIHHTDKQAFIDHLNPATLTLPDPIPLDQNSELLAHQTEINHCFSQPTIIEIINELEKFDKYCQYIASMLKQRSPLSLAVTLEYLKRSEGQDFKTVMAMNHTLIQHFIRGTELYEGVRAAIIDKDRQPQWQYSLEEMATQSIDHFFEDWPQHNAG